MEQMDLERIFVRICVHAPVVVLASGTSSWSFYPCSRTFVRLEDSRYWRMDGWDNKERRKFDLGA